MMQLVAGGRVKRLMEKAFCIVFSAVLEVVTGICFIPEAFDVVCTLAFNSHRGEIMSARNCSFSI